ncbi:MAG: hypothetical protein WAU75_20665 [Solirubrobacteraceae bacterium]
MGTVVRLYLGWRLLRLLRPLIGAALIVAVMLALHGAHAGANSSAASTLERAFGPGPAPRR